MGDHDTISQVWQVLDGGEQSEQVQECAICIEEILRSWSTESLAIVQRVWQSQSTHHLGVQGKDKQGTVNSVGELRWIRVIIVGNLC